MTLNPPGGEGKSQQGNRTKPVPDVEWIGGRFFGTDQSNGTLAGRAPVCKMPAFYADAKV
jgi:hypothetical protein